MSQPREDDYAGDFVIELTADANQKTIPAGLAVNGLRITVPGGKIRFSSHGPEFRTKGGMPFYWNGKFISSICSTDGQRLWPKSREA